MSLLFQTNRPPPSYVFFLMVFQEVLNANALRKSVERTVKAPVSQNITATQSTSRTPSPEVVSMKAPPCCVITGNPKESIFGPRCFAVKIKTFATERWFQRLPQTQVRLLYLKKKNN